jgi:hypothetical protein
MGARLIEGMGAVERSCPEAGTLNVEIAATANSRKPMVWVFARISPSLLPQLALSRVHKYVTPLQLSGNSLFPDTHTRTSTCWIHQ